MAQELLCSIADVLDAWPGFGRLTETRQASLIERASSAIIGWCRRPGFVQATYDHLFDGKNSPRIWLRQIPILDVASVQLNGEPLDNVHGDAWTWNSRTGELIRGNGRDDVRFAPWFPAGRGNVRVVYAAGYVEVPPDVTEATVNLIQYLASRTRVSGVYKSESIGDYSYTLADSGPGSLIRGDIAWLLTDYVMDDGPL